MPRQDSKKPLQNSLRLVLKLLSRCASGSQPSDALLSTLVELLRLSEGQNALEIERVRIDRLEKRIDDLLMEIKLKRRAI